MNLQIKGRVALVAGATSGLGLAVGRALANEGVKVALCGRRREVGKAEATALVGAIGVELDISEANSVKLAVETVRDELGRIDIVVLNGGGPAPSRASELDVERARQDGELLLYGPIGLALQCLTAMREKKWGRIVAIGSSAIHQPIPGLATSSMFRAALASYLKLLAEEVAPDGVTVNMVLPGRIPTDRLAQLDSRRAELIAKAVAEVQSESEGAVPIGRYGTADEFASVAAFLCGESARYITGEQFRVDGGLIRAI